MSASDPRPSNGGGEASALRTFPGSATDAAARAVAAAPPPRTRRRVRPLEGGFVLSGIAGILTVIAGILTVTAERTRRPPTAQPFGSRQSLVDLDLKHSGTVSVRN